MCGQCTSVLTESHVCKALFHLCSLFFSSLWSSLRLHALISFAGLSLIYVLCGLKWGSADFLWYQSHATLCTAPNWLKCPKSLALCSHQSVWDKHCSRSPVCVFLSVPLLFHLGCNWDESQVGYLLSESDACSCIYFIMRLKRSA